MRSPVAAQQLWWPRLLAVLLLAMIRVLVRRNGTQDPAFALRIDTVGDAATAKQAFVDEGQRACSEWSAQCRTRRLGSSCLVV